MDRLTGTVSRGIRAPIIRKGDDIAEIVVKCVLHAAKQENFQIHDKDVVGITEAVVARAQGNYATIDQIAEDIKTKYEDKVIGLVFPILSRNRFSICLKGIAKGAKKIILLLSYPSDEVGNHLIDIDSLDEKCINPWSDVLTEEEFRRLFGYVKHPFTGIDYIEYYKNIIQAEGCDVEVILANDCRTILKYTKHVLCCDIHSRARTKRLLKNAGAETLYGLDDILSSPVNGSGYNETYGLLGSNKATEDTVKLFPRDCQPIVDKISQRFLELTGKHVEVMIYGDGAFRDPVGKIWELADPVVSPAYTGGLVGQPNEVKLKYIADNNFSQLKGKELEAAVSEYIRNKDHNLVEKEISQGTTPRRLTDLIGSLCDLTSGSGDKGTPIVLIQGYFDNYTDN
jgi:F420-0:Gamma-glutamyl ligase.